MHNLLQGLSGCKISVEFIGSSYCLVKSTQDPAYVPRLIKQANKQIEYSNLQLPDFFRVPTIYNIDYGGDHASIAMEYVRGVSIVEYLNYANPKQIKWLQEALVRLVNLFHMESASVTLSATKVREKLHYTVQKLQVSSHDITWNLSLQPLLEKICRRFESLPQILSLPMGYSHGDLTFSNILIDPLGPTIVLIDFLDSFIETALLDMVKLRQDTYYAWSCNVVRQSPNVRLKTIMKHMDIFFDGHFKQYPYYKQYYTYFQLLNLVRILPYLSSSHLAQTVERAIQIELGL